MDHRGSRSADQAHRPHCAANAGQVCPGSRIGKPDSTYVKAFLRKKFGYEPASKWGIKCPIEVPDENFMAIELYPGALSNVKGTVEYPKEFGIN